MNRNLWIGYFRDYYYYYFFLSIFPSESYAREDISIFQSVMDGATAEDVYIRKRASYRERFNEDFLGL